MFLISFFTNSGRVKIIWIIPLNTKIATITLNIGLGIFNLIPLPPLDGSKVIKPFLPYNAKTWFIEHEQIFYFVFLIIWITGIAGSLISPLIGKMTQLILNFAMSIFGLR